jgi:23S rRNA (uracil1939-C5)-methyltransferase
MIPDEKRPPASYPDASRDSILSVAEIVDLRIEKVAALGEGLASMGGKKVFVPFTAPGELVSARIVEDRRDFARAELVDLKEASPDRIDPACHLFARCGGCTLQHLSERAQREARLRIMDEAFERAGIGFADPSRIAMRDGPAFGYRNRFRFIGTEKGPGLLEGGSARAVHLPSCPVASASIDAFLRSDGADSAVADTSRYGRIGEGERKNVYGGSKGLFIEGRDDVAKEIVDGKTLSFRTGGFFQSNAGMLAVLVRDLVEMMPGGIIADLYGGCGTFSTFLAGRAERVTLVEEDPLSASMAKENSSGEGRMDVYAMRVEEWIKFPTRKARFDAVIVDPPRGGLSVAVRSWIKSSGVPSIAYVSCDPVTLARDMADIEGDGYSADFIGAYDFYPQTARLECLAILRKTA